MRQNIKNCLKSITEYLTPLLPLANAHMVEFFTEDHWNNLVPKHMRSDLDKLDNLLEFDIALNNAFWDLESIFAKGKI